MPPSDFRIVIDTNTLLRGIVSRRSAAAKLLTAALNRSAIPLLSKPVLDEYRAVLTDTELQGRFPDLSPARVALTLNRIVYVAEVTRKPRARFTYQRDPDDEKFIELAIELHATHIVSADKDLLSLPFSRSDAGKRFRQRLPNVLVLESPVFVERYAAEIQIE